MAAVVLAPTPAIGPRPAARLQPAHRARPSAVPPPVLISVPSPSASVGHRRHPAAVYRRRRVLVGLGALLLVAGIVNVAGRVAGALGSWRDDPTVTTTDLPGAGRPAAAPSARLEGDVYVVRAGDSLWSIANAVAPDADPRPVVDELSRRAGGPALRPGQRVPVQGLR
jgi:hypothetical protein